MVVNGHGKRRGFLRKEPAQPRSRALVEAVITATNELGQTLVDEGEITIERIVRRAGVGLGSFYDYFADKDSLIGELVSRATHHNFAALLAALDAASPPTLEAAFTCVAEHVVDLYLAHPARTRLWIAGIGRLQLMRMVVEERDRFARQLAIRAQRFLPRCTDDEITEAMTAVCDANLGLVVSDLYRERPRSRAVVVSAMTVTAVALVARLRDEPEIPRTAVTALP